MTLCELVVEDGFGVFGERKKNEGNFRVKDHSNRSGRWLHEKKLAGKGAGALKEKRAGRLDPVSAREHP